jgi:hypothetical protein
MGDAAMPEIEQVAHRRLGGSHVVDADMRPSRVSRLTDTAVKTTVLPTARHHCGSSAK